MNEAVNQEIQRLVTKYQRLSTRDIKHYNEANTKDGFIRPLFEALGWDFSNLDEVEGEKTITSGRVDYLFKLNKVSKFCLEIKALHVDINEERWIRQAIGYAYNKGVTWALLTNFKTLRVFNAERETRDINQVAFLNIACENYLSDFHRLWLLSREAVDNGDLDREAVAYGRLPPRLPIEKRLYAQLRNWRETLFNEIYIYYKDDKDEKLSWSQVDKLVQLLLNRLIFIRTVEDRGLIDMNLLAARHQWESSDGKTDLMGSIRGIFKQFSHLYDSELFPQIMDPWDSISLHNDRILSDIIQGLYEVPGGLADWKFDTIGSDVLGAVYEQYLGYIPARVKKEEKEAQKRLFPEEPHIGITAKKEKRKGEGIYYTPPWVVDYIVKQTVGRFIEERSYNDILNIKILDPACGSGSFLTRAYEELLNYHARQQGKTPAELDQAERTRILLRNIYGVDLDQQAVEIARLSLLLCSLSGQETLPSLANNIRRGNSLISSTDEELQRYFGDNWEEKHRFNWEDEFPEIMKQDGFDVVIGNPPWGSFFTDLEKKYLYKYYVGHHGEAESHLFFIQRGLQLLNESGILGFITPNTWLSVLNSKEIREYLIEHATFYEICELSKYIFEDAPDIVPILVFFGKKNGYQRSCIVKRANVIRVHASNFGDAFTVSEIAQEIWRGTPSNVINLRITSGVRQIIERCLTKSTPLSEICTVLYGIKTGDNKQYLSSSISDTHRVKALKTGELVRYHIEWKGIHLWWCPELAGYRASPLNVPKIIVQYIRKLSLSRRIIAALDTDGLYYPLNNYSYSILKEEPYSLKYVLGILNSALMNFYFANTYIDYNIKPTYLQQLPIRRIDFENIAEKKMHNELVSLVDRMLYLNRGLAPIRNNPCNERDELMREIERTDRKIDNLVYDLYGLTEEEREIVGKETESGGS